MFRVHPIFVLKIILSRKYVHLIITNFIALKNAPCLSVLWRGYYEKRIILVNRLRFKTRCVRCMITSTCSSGATYYITRLCTNFDDFRKHKYGIGLLVGRGCRGEAFFEVEPSTHVHTIHRRRL